MPWTRNDMAARAARELRDGFYVILGIGIPTLVADNIPSGMDVTLQSEHGIIGPGPYPGGAEVDAAVSYEIGRGSCRERGGRYVLISVLAGPLNKKKQE